MRRRLGQLLQVAILFALTVELIQGNLASGLTRSMLRGRPLRTAAATGVGVRSNFPTSKPPSHTISGSPYGETLSLGNTKDPKGLVMFMHGLGTTATNWAPIAKSFAQRFPSLLFLLPTAAERRFTQQKATMPAWFELSESVEDFKENIETLEESASFAHALSESTTEQHGIPATNVVYGGFSQGAVVSIFAGLTAPVRPKGILAMSGYLRGGHQLSKAAKYRNVPLLICHGASDPVIPPALSRASVEALKLMGVASSAITHKVYPDLTHTYSSQELTDVQNWLSSLQMEDT